MRTSGGREEHRQFREQFKIRPRILIDDDGQVGRDVQLDAAVGRRLQQHLLQHAAEHERARVEGDRVRVQPG